MKIKTLKPSSCRSSLNLIKLIINHEIFFFIFTKEKWRLESFSRKGTLSNYSSRLVIYQTWLNKFLVFNNKNLLMLFMFRDSSLSSTENSIMWKFSVLDRNKDGVNFTYYQIFNPSF